MNLTLWLWALFGLGVATMLLVLAFITACEKV
jgi:hypothetical protein